MTRLIEGPQGVTADWCASVLAKAGVSADAVVDVSVEPVGTGQLGYTVRAVLEGDSGPLSPSSLIIKFASLDDHARQTGVAMGVYESEIRFFQEIASTVDVAVPECYLAEVDLETGYFTLVLDDLSNVASVGDQEAGGTVDQASLALTELVKLQAPRWDDASLFDRPWLSVDKMRMLFGLFPHGVAAFEARFADSVPEEHFKLATRILPHAVDWIDQWSGPRVVVHGDYRLDNMLFGRHHGAPPLTVIDWQGARLGPPLLDVAYFLGNCLSVDDRRAHQEQLVRDYHRGLVSAGVDGYPFDDCWQNLRFMTLYGVLMASGMPALVESTERGDAVIRDAFVTLAQMAIDLDAEETLKV